MEQLQDSCLDLQNRLQAAEARETELASELTKQEGELTKQEAEVRTAWDSAAVTQQAYDRLVEEVQTREDEVR